jgi:hypothetical protein
VTHAIKIRERRKQRWHRNHHANQKRSGPTEDQSGRSIQSYW